MDDRGEPPYVIEDQRPDSLMLVYRESQSVDDSDDQPGGSATTRKTPPTKVNGIRLIWPTSLAVKGVSQIKAEFIGDFADRVCIRSEPAILGEGAGATMDGVFLREPEACRATVIARRRNDARKVRQRGQLKQALAGLRAVGEECGEFMAPLSAAWLHSDIALIAHKIGDDATCRTSVKVANETMDAVGCSVNDCDGIKRALKTNHRLCPAVQTKGKVPRAIESPALRK